MATRHIVIDLDLTKAPAEHLKIQIDPWDDESYQRMRMVALQNIFESLKQLIVEYEVEK